MISKFLLAPDTMQDNVEIPIMLTVTEEQVCTVTPVRCRRGRHQAGDVCTGPIGGAVVFGDDVAVISRIGSITAPGWHG
jgi:class 3 adenylate cyclase